MNNLIAQMVGTIEMGREGVSEISILGSMFNNEGLTMFKSLVIPEAGSSEPGKCDQEIMTSQNKLGIQNPGQSWVAV